MKFALFLGLLALGYYFLLSQVTDLALTQVQNINATYSHVANNSEHIATGR